LFVPEKVDKVGEILKLVEVEVEAEAEAVV
jgi:hypothetical protein